MSFKIKDITAKTFIITLPIPSNVTANETEERPLIKVSTANGGRRPTLQNKSILLFCFFSFSYH
jgi:hypothetical protein